MDKATHRMLLYGALNIKNRFLGMYKQANAGHVGCSLSVAEVMTFVRFGWMKDTDEIILSKGHAAAVLYSMLVEDGTLTEDDIKTFYQNNTSMICGAPLRKN